MNSKPVEKSEADNIFQIYFRPEQENGLSPEFTPYFKTETEEIEWREYWTFLKNHQEAIASKGRTGYLSWKFETKSGVKAGKFLHFIAQNPGYDVYFLNPFPLDALLFDSIWAHGEEYHPGLIEFTASLMAKAGYSANIRHMQHPPELAGFSNYWVGNSKFWEAYINFTKPLEQYIRSGLTPSESKYLYSLADKVSNCSHIPFIFERLFTTLLIVNPELKAIAYKYDTQDLKNRYSWPERILYRILCNPRCRANWLGKSVRYIFILTRRIRDAFR